MEILSRSLIIINVNTNAGNRTFNFVISNSLTSLQTTMQTNLNLEMEKFEKEISTSG